MLNNRFTTLYAFDLDHTIIQPDNILKTPGLDRLMLFIESERRDGAIFAIISGRSREDAISAIREGKFSLPDYLITDLGSKIYSKSDNFKKSLLHFEHNNWERKVVDLIMKNDPAIISRKASRSTEFKLSYYFKPNLIVLSRIKSAFQKEHMSVDIIIAKNKYLYLVPKGINKASALRFLMKKIGLKSSEVFGAGDDHMDLPMLKIAGISVLVAGNKEGVVVKNIRKNIYVSKTRYAKGILEGIYNVRSKVRTKSRRLRFWSLLSRGNFQENQGYFGKAEKSYKVALSVAEALGYELGVIRSLYKLGRAKTSLGNAIQGISLINRAYVLAKDLVVDKNLMVDIINSLVFAYRISGQNRMASKYLNKGLSISGLQNARSASLYHNKGGLYRDAGNLKDAFNCYHKAFILNKSDKILKTKTINNIGFILKKQGQLSKALAYYKRALLSEKNLGLLSLMSRTLNNIGGIYRANNEPVEALEYFLRSAKIRKSIGDVAGLSSSYLNAGRALSDVNKQKEAKKFFLLSLQIRKRLRAPYLYQEVVNEIKNASTIKVS